MKKILLRIIFLLFFPLIFIFNKLINFNNIKISILDPKFGQTLRFIEGYLVSKKYYDFQELKNIKIIFFLNFDECNSQIRKMISKKVKVFNLNFFFKTIFYFFNLYKNQNIFIDISKKYPLKMLMLKQKKNPYNLYKKNFIDFSENEIKIGKNFLQKFNLKEEHKWICIANRDQNFKKEKFKNFDWNYHKYRNFSVLDFNEAVEKFTKKGFYVFRMGHFPEEKFDLKNEMVIDYASSDLKNDFLDVFLLRYCKFYFGGDTGPSDIAFNFMKPAYGVNFSSTLIDSGRSHLPWLFTIKRIKNLKNGKFLSLREILSSNFASSYKYEEFLNSNVKPISNNRKEISDFAEEVLKDLGNENYETNEDLSNQKKFWEIYYNYVPKSKMGQVQPKISPCFLRNNADLLN